MKFNIFFFSVIVFIIAAPVLEAQSKGKCGPNLSYTLKKRDSNFPNQYELVISGKGNMLEAPWKENKDLVISSVSFPKELTSIADHAFEDIRFHSPYRFELKTGRHKMTKPAMMIPESVKFIGDNAFTNCYFDYTPYIPDNVTYIGKEAFKGAYLYFIEDWDWGCPSDVIGGWGLEEIGEKAFCETNFLSFYINKVKKIGKYVFANSKLEAIGINEGLEVLSEGTFFECINLNDIEIENSSIIIIESKAFEGCSNVKHITLPRSLQSIGDRSFLGCKSLTEIIIPEKIQTIGHYAFWNCTSLSTIRIPDNVSFIGQGFLAYCPSLSLIESNYSSRDKRCLIIDKVLIAFAPNQLSRYTIPDDVEQIGDYVFAGCDKLETITLPDKLKVIGNRAFKGCKNLTSITIPANVTTIKNSAFEGCDKIDMVIIPSSVSTIEENAFGDCVNLKLVYVTNPYTTIANNAFPKNTKIVYSKSNNPPAIIAINSIVLKDPYESNVLNGGTNNYIELSITNEGYEYGSGNAKILMNGNTKGLSSFPVAIGISQGNSTVIRIPINADESLSSGTVDLKVQLSLDNGYSYGNDQISVETQAHGTSANELSAKGKMYKRAAEELLSNATNTEGLLAAIKEYEKLTQSDPYYGDVYFNLGKLYTSLAKIKGNPYFDKAIENYKQFAKLIPEERQSAEAEIYAVQTLKNNYKAY